MDILPDFFGGAITGIRRPAPCPRCPLPTTDGVGLGGSIRKASDSLKLRASGVDRIDHPEPSVQLRICAFGLLGHFLLSSLGDGQDKTGRQCRSAYVASPRLTGTNSRTRYYCCGLKCTVVGPRQVSQERDTRPSSPSKRPTEIEPSPSGVRMRRLRERWSQNCVSERRVTACQSSALALDGAPPGGDSKSDEALPDTDRGPRRADYEAREPNQPPARIRRVRRDRCGDRPGRRLRSGQGIATDVTSPSTLRRSHAAPWSSDSVGPSKWSPPNGTARRGTAPTSSF